MALRRDSGVATASGERWVASSGSIQASRTAIDCLKAGGNVVDAALAAAAVNCVVLPQATSIGGDLFALVKLKGQPAFSINATGAAPAQADIAAYKKLGLDFVPRFGGLGVQGPGFVAGWEAMRSRWGSRTRAELLEPAIAFAKGGFPMGWKLAEAISSHRDEMAKLPGFADLFLDNGRPLWQGRKLRQPQLAATLASIAQEGPRAFYSGPVARDIARAVKASGGFLHEGDLASISADIEAPLTVRYRGLDILSQPPITQGVILLRALGLLEAAVPNPKSLAEADFWVQAAKCLRRAFNERLALLRDGPDRRQLAEDMLAGKGALPGPGVRPPLSGAHTTTVAVMDHEGNAVSLIQSVFSELGSGVVAEESGVLLNNRLMGFFLDPGQPNALAPRRRSMHTLHSYLVLEGDDVRFAGGSPGADQQPQVNVQVLTRMLDLGQAPAAAIDAPRWALVPGTRPEDIVRVAPGIEVEAGVPETTRNAFKAGDLPVKIKRAQRIGSSKIVGRTKGQLGAWAD